MRVEWWCGVASRHRRSAAAVRAKCGCGPAGGSRPQIEPTGGGDGFSRVRPASVCSLAEERCAVRALLIFEVRAVRQSFECVCGEWCLSALRFFLRTQRSELPAALHSA